MSDIDSAVEAEPSPTSEEKNPAAEVQGLIIKWANEQPLWKQRALRFVLGGSTKEDDLKVVADAAVATVDPKHSSDIPPISSADFTSNVGGIEAFQLVEIRDVAHVNRLVSGETLAFGPKGLTVVYGDNGSGKSGYARLLKRACGGRDQEAILPNVFEAAPGAPAAAKFSLNVGSGAPVVVDWTDGNPPHALLGSAAIFDTRTAPFYVERAANLAFIPYGLNCFEQLATFLDGVSATLQSRIGEIDTACATPLVEGPLADQAGLAFDALLPMSVDQLSAHLQWDKELDATLQEHAHAVADPAARVRDLRKSAATLDLHIEDLTKWGGIVTDDRLLEARALFADAVAAQAAAEATAGEQFSAQPLEGVGSAAWLLLFEAARQFSATLAYPGRDFPPVEEGDRCVLCLQDLAPEARQRLTDFDAFVKSEVSAKAADKRSKVEALRVAFGEAAAAAGLFSVDLTLRANAPDEAATLDALHVAVGQRLDAGLRALEGKEVKVEPSNDGGMQTCIKKSKELSSIANSLQAIIDAGQAQRLADKKAELEIRRAFCNSAAIVKERHGHKQRRAILIKAQAGCNTAGVTRQGGELLRRFVTDELATAFGKEAAALQVTSAEVRLNATPKKGAVERSLNLGTQQVKATPPLILSEGEYRAASLAAFFAEQSTLPQGAPMIIDDPVSSLDHMRREKVAHRLATLAATRQVIIFTHDLPFLMMLHEACAKAAVELTPVYLERAKGGFGSVSDQPAPWDALAFKQRRNHLEQRLSELKKHYEETGDDETYRNRITVFYDRARKTWERGVEELIFQQAVVRFRRSVETLRLKSAPIDQDLYVAVTNGMTDASAITGHDQAGELGGAWPDPAKAEAVLAGLKAFEELAKTKAQEARKAREA
jgi:hypothetical protein